jgi:Polyketide cyclase / dehydrase and lipid transport
MSEPEAPRHSESIRIAAPRARVWELVIAMDRYGEWSSENTGGYWRKGADGEPGTGQVGDQFVGINRRDGAEWKAPVEIIERDEERAFGFVTGGTEMNLALWRYQLDDDDEGTLLTEEWALRNRAFFLDLGGEDEIVRRAANARESIGATLRGMKATAEGA